MQQMGDQCLESNGVPKDWENIQKDYSLFHGQVLASETQRPAVYLLGKVGMLTQEPAQIFDIPTHLERSGKQEKQMLNLKIDGTWRAMA